jgi:hypothetical protein
VETRQEIVDRGNPVTRGRFLPLEPQPTRNLSLGRQCKRFCC